MLLVITNDPVVAIFGHNNSERSDRACKNLKFKNAKF